MPEVLNLATTRQQIIDDKVHDMHVKSLTDLDDFHEELLFLLGQLVVAALVKLLDVEQEGVLQQRDDEGPDLLLDLIVLIEGLGVDLVGISVDVLIYLELTAHQAVVLGLEVANFDVKVGLVTGRLAIGILFC